MDSLNQYHVDAIFQDRNRAIEHDMLVRRAKASRRCFPAICLSPST